MTPYALPRRSATSLAVGALLIGGLLGADAATAAKKKTCKPAPKANCAGVNLAKRNLAGKNLKGINLKGANLTRANLKGANLTGATLTNAKLGRANLTNAIVTSARMGGASVNGATVTGLLSGSVSGTPNSLPTGWQLNTGYLMGPGANLTGANLILSLIHI